MSILFKITFTLQRKFKENIFFYHVSFFLYRMTSSFKKSTYNLLHKLYVLFIRNLTALLFSQHIYLIHIDHIPQGRK